MISSETVETVRELKRTTGMSNRRIAAQVGLNHNTVDCIVSWRGAYGFAAGPVAEVEGFREVEKPERCPTCGALLNVVPCVACRAEAYGPVRRSPREAGGHPVIGLDLEPEDRDRYVKVARRAAAARLAMEACR